MIGQWVKPGACLQGVRSDNAAIGLDQPPVVGYNVQNTMRGILRALRHLHMLRGFDMADSTYSALKHYVFTILNKKLRVGRHACRRCLWNPPSQGVTSSMPVVVRLHTSSLCALLLC